MTRKAYSNDVSDEAWAFVAPTLTLMDEAAPQRNYPLRDVDNGLHSLLRTGAPWRMLPTDLSMWHVVSQQTQRWLKAGVFEQMVHDVRMLLRASNDRSPQPHAVTLDRQTLPSTPESGGRAGYDGRKRCNGTKAPRRGYARAVAGCFGHAVQRTRSGARSRAGPTDARGDR